MASKRKLWKTTTNGNPLTVVRFGSQRAAYKFVNAWRSAYRQGARTVYRITVWVDERDGQGWQRYEVLDFASEVPDAG